MILQPRGIRYEAQGPCEGHSDYVGVPNELKYAAGYRKQSRFRASLSSKRVTRTGGSGIGTLDDHCQARTQVHSNAPYGTRSAGSEGCGMTPCRSRMVRFLPLGTLRPPSKLCSRLMVEATYQLGLLRVHVGFVRTPEFMQSQPFKNWIKWGPVCIHPQ